MTSRLTEAQDELFSELADLTDDERVALLSGVSGIADVWRKVNELLEACDEIQDVQFSGKLATVETATNEFSFLIDVNDWEVTFDALEGHNDAREWLGRNREKLHEAYHTAACRG